jgi:hypothetical protein
MHSHLRSRHAPTSGGMTVRIIARALAVPRLTLLCMWESPTGLWRRLKLGREEYLQRLVTTLILDGEAPPWNTLRSPGEAGRNFLRLLDEAAHGRHDQTQAAVSPDWFVDEYLLPKLDESAANGWPDWAVLWGDRAWVIELKTEAGSHRADQLSYYLRLAAAAHPGCSLDLTYITGPLTKPAPALVEGQRYSHLTWDEVLPLIDEAWGQDARPEVAPYLDMVHTVVSNLSRLKPSEQREVVLGVLDELEPPSAIERAMAVTVEQPTALAPDVVTVRDPISLLALARATATDGHQRAVGAQRRRSLRGSATKRWPTSEASSPTTSLDLSFHGCGMPSAPGGEHSRMRATNSDTS